MNSLPSSARSCADAKVKSNFVTGADSQDGRHTSDLWSYADVVQNGIARQANLDQYGLQQVLQRGGKNPIINVANGSEVYQPNSDCTGANAVWMTCVFPPGSPGAQTDLSNIAFPGSHDSATPFLNVTEESLADNGCDQTSAFERVALPLVYNLAVAQRLNLRQQLDAGMRYVDIRAAYDDKNSVWRSHHTLFTQSTLEQDLATVAQWAGARGQREPVIVEITVCDAGGSPNDHIGEFQDLFTDRLTLNKNVTTPPFNLYSLHGVAMNPPGNIQPVGLSRISMQDIYDFPKPSGNVLLLLHQPTGNAQPGETYDKSFLQQTPAFLRQPATESNDNSGPPPYKDTSRVPINSYWPNEQGNFTCGGNS